nr:phage integrase N-terminal SAM-like domain-containing protein [Desulfobulbaceae bacterium]
MSTSKEQFVDRMNFYGLAEHTQRNYITGVRGLAQYYNLPPVQLMDDQVRAYFHHLITERKLEWTSCKSYLSGITFFYRHICDREVDDRFGLPPRPRGRKLPVILSIEEVLRLLVSPPRNNGPTC